MRNFSLMGDRSYFIVDSHEDLAWNMLTFGRDYTQTVQSIRDREAHTEISRHNGSTLLGWDAYQQGKVGVVFATLFNAPMRKKEGDWDILCYQDAAQAHRLYQRQVDIYHKLVEEQPNHFRLIGTKKELESHLEEWQQAPDFTSPEAPPESENLNENDNQSPADRPPVGLVILMEGAEGVQNAEELPQWWQSGVRLIGPAWIGTRFCGGTGEPGKLTKEGFQLLEAMAEIGFILDLSHMDEQAVLQALDVYAGAVVATHANPLAMLPDKDSNRFLPDHILEGILERNGVVGIVPYNLFLDSNWAKGMRRELVSIHQFADHIDYVCQVAGDAKHVGIGSDFDGGFGWQSVPEEIDTIADLQKLAPLLTAKGYTESDLVSIFGGNWLDMLQSSLPEDA